MQLKQEFKSISQLSRKRKKKHEKIVLLGKDKLNRIEILISKAIIDSYICHDEFVSVNNVLRQYYEIKNETKSPETSLEYIIVSIKINILLTKLQVSGKLNNMD